MRVDPIVVNNKLFHMAKVESPSNGRWVMFKCTQDSQKVCTKLLSLPDNGQKLNFESLS